MAVTTRVQGKGTKERSHDYDSSALQQPDVLERPPDPALRGPPRGRARHRHGRAGRSGGAREARGDQPEREDPGAGRGRLRAVGAERDQRVPVRVDARADAVAGRAKGARGRPSLAVLDHGSPPAGMRRPQLRALRQEGARARRGGSAGDRGARRGDSSLREGSRTALRDANVARERLVVARGLQPRGNLDAQRTWSVSEPALRASTCSRGADPRDSRVADGGGLDDDGWIRVLPHRDLRQHAGGVLCTLASTSAQPSAVQRAGRSPGLRFRARLSRGAHSYTGGPRGGALSARLAVPTG